MKDSFERQRDVDYIQRLQVLNGDLSSRLGYSLRLNKHQDEYILKLQELLTRNDIDFEYMKELSV